MSDVAELETRLNAIIDADPDAVSREQAISLSQVLVGIVMEQDKRLSAIERALRNPPPSVLGQ